MGNLVMQWHITNRCNKRCKHCYQEGYSSDDLKMEELLKIGEQYLNLLKRYNREIPCKPKGQINLTGGEPFIREDIWRLLDFFKENKKYFSFGILTNGPYLTEEVVKRLKSYNPKMIQLSLDGGESTHDYLRGEGSYKEVIKALKLLNKYKIKGLVSFTANNKNYEEFKDVVKASRNGKAYKVWTDRLVPIGNGDNSKIKTLNPEEVLKYIDIIKKESTNIKSKIYKTKVCGDRSLHFLNGNSISYKCSAGNGLIVVLENGDIMPCRRLPIVAGNISRSSLEEIYYETKIFKELRNEITPKGCEKCGYIKECNGGAKCISYGVYGDYNIGDYGCILKKK